jgi:hypothetical protein
MFIISFPFGQGKENSLANSECGIQNAEWTEWGIRNVECGLKKKPKKSEIRNPQSEIKENPVDFRMGMG